MRFKKAIAAGVAACVMAASAASLVKSVSALSEESPAAAIDVTIELVGVTDDYAAKVPLSVVLDNMTYAHDVFDEEASGEDEGVSPGVSESEPEDTSEGEYTSEPESGGESVSEPESSEESEPADDPELSEDSEPDNDLESEPAEEPENDDDEDDDTVEDVPETPETPELPEPTHRRGDKVEIPEGAEFVWVDGEQYSISDKNATLNLFVEESADEYIVEKTLIIGTQAENTVYNAQFGISKNRWTFEDFELYTTDPSGEKTALNAVLGELGLNSAFYIITSPVDGGKNVYLKLSPRFTVNGEVSDDVDVEVLYRGTNPKDECILTDGGIVVDLLAFDKEGNLILKQEGVAITAAVGTLKLGAVIDPEGEAPVEIGAASAFEPEANNAAEFVAMLEAGFGGAEHTVKITSLFAEAFAAEIAENDVIKAALGRFASLEDAQDADDVKAALFGEGFAAEINDGTELTLFIEPRSVLGLGAKDFTAYTVHIRFGVSTVDDNKPGEPVAEEPNKPTVPNDPDETGEPDDPDEPDIPKAPEEPEPVELYFDGTNKVYFDNISGGKAVLNITSSTNSLRGFDVVLEDAELVTLGGVEVSGGSARITLNAVRGADGEMLYGGVSGTLTVTADNADPLVIKLRGESGCAAITERKTWSTAMKYVPYLAEYSLDREYPWLSATYSVIGELPDGLTLNAETGKLSGAPAAVGRFSFKVAATLAYKDGEVSPSATVTREVAFTVVNNTARNLYMLTDPDYGFYSPLGDNFDGRAYYLNSDETDGRLKVTLKGECSEFYDLWLDGVKLTRRSDEYKTYHGATEITFEEGAFGRLSEDEIHTLVFAYKPNSSDNLKLAAQNLIITDNKPVIVPDDGARDYYNMYTPANKLGGELAGDYAAALSSVRLYVPSGALPDGAKTLVRANTEQSKGGVGMDIIIADENGEALVPSGSVTAKMNLPESFGEVVHVYFLENGKYREASATVRDGQVFFALSGSKTVIVSQRTIDPNAKPGSNPATGVALSSAGLVTSGAALVMILTSKRRKSE